MRFFIVLLYFGFFATAAVNGFPACSNAISIISTTNFVFSPGGTSVYACPLNGADTQTAVWVLNGHCNFSGPADFSACIDQSGSQSLVIMINDTRAVCSAASPIALSCFNGLSNTSITLDCRSPGFYLTNTSRFNATAGSPFSTISAWIGYGLISASLQLREYINGSYVPTDMFAVDYTRLGRCVMATPEPYPPLQFTIRLGGKDADIPQFLVGQHVFVAFGNDSTSARYMSPPIYLEVLNVTPVPPPNPNADLSVGKIVGIVVGGSFVGLVIIVVVVILIIVFRKKMSVLERAVAWITDMIQKRNTEEMDLANFSPTQDAKPAVAICSVHI